MIHDIDLVKEDEYQELIRIYQTEGREAAVAYLGKFPRRTAIAMHALFIEQGHTRDWEAWERNSRRPPWPQEEKTLPDPDPLVE